MSEAVATSSGPGDSAGRPSPFARDVFLVARYELSEALRTRLLLVMLVLFVVGGALGAWGFTKFVEGMEAQTSRMLGLPRGERPGETLRMLQKTPFYRGILRAAVSDPKKADYLATLPPIVVFFGWASMMFLPWLVLFTSADTIATEVSSRAIRYAALRTTRLAYALGKALGQAAIVLGVTLLSGGAFFAVAWVTLSAFDLAATIAGILLLVPRVFAYALPFLAFALFASMATSSANLARILALIGTVGLAVLAGLCGENSPLRTGSAAGVLLDVLSFATPFGHASGFSYPFDARFAIDLATCLGLAVAYFAAGYAILRRRDL
jgi:ABC-type transport system involved in multi-copper enzyme maturation permease subunit